MNTRALIDVAPMVFRPVEAALCLQSYSFSLEAIGDGAVLRALPRREALRGFELGSKGNVRVSTDLATASLKPEEIPGLSSEAESPIPGETMPPPDLGDPATQSPGKPVSDEEALPSFTPPPLPDIPAEQHDAAASKPTPRTDTRRQPPAGASPPNAPEEADPIEPPRLPPLPEGNGEDGVPPYVPDQEVPISPPGIIPEEEL
jgi:hypothetical protein